MKTKVCKSCLIEKPREDFARKYSSKFAETDQRKSRCKSCFAKHRRERNPNRRIYEGKSTPKKTARKAARNEFGPSSQWMCSVLFCELPAADLHHFDYSKKLEVIPLCRAHHGDIHGVKFVAKPF